MSATAHTGSTNDTVDASVFYYDVESGDGTMLRAWTNDPDCLIDGPTVVLCNGLGTNPWTTPSVLRPGAGVRVISWNHRGTGGSARPTDRRLLMNVEVGELHFQAALRRNRRKGPGQRAFAHSAFLTDKRYHDRHCPTPSRPTAPKRERQARAAIA